MERLSPLVLTLVYSTYAFGVLATLLLAGRLSDDTGRRPVLLVALGTLMGATVSAATASATDSASLFLAGAATGGAGFGVASLGALHALTPVIPGEHRAAVLSAFYLMSYGALSVAAVVSGLAYEATM